MAVTPGSSSTSSTSLTTASIDVAGIVAQLMTAENKPLDAIKAKISTQQLIISDLGTVKSNIASFGAALKSFQDPNSYNTAAASSSDSTTVQATASNGALLGSYQVNVTQIAQASKYAITGFSSAGSAVALDATAGFKLTVGNQTFSTKGVLTTANESAKVGFTQLSAGQTLSMGGLTFTAGSAGATSTQVATAFANITNGTSYTDANTNNSLSDGVGGVFTAGSMTDWSSANLPVNNAVVFTSTTVNTNVPDLVVTGTGGLTTSVVTTQGAATSTTAAIGAAPTLSALKDWINGLGVNVQAGVVQTTASNQWALTIQGTLTGVDNAVTYAGLNTGTLSAPATVVARNAQFSVNGVNFERASNAVADAVSGISLNLLAPTGGAAATISVSPGADNTVQMINGLITAYNTIINQYVSLTANSSNSSKPGDFANNPGLLSFMNDIKSKMATGISYGSPDPQTGIRKTMSLASMGMDLQLDGTIKFNSIEQAMASSNGLQSILAGGAHIGYVDATHDLLTFVNSETSASGAINQQINSQSNSVIDLQNRQDDLQGRLNSIQNNYISQYSALNALLFQLSSTSNALTSALSALTNMRAGN